MRKVRAGIGTGASRRIAYWFDCQSIRSFAKVGSQVICNALIVTGLIFPKFQLAFPALAMPYSWFHTHRTHRVLVLTTAWFSRISPNL